MFGRACGYSDLRLDKLVHPAQTVAQQPHHVERKSRGLLNEKKEPFFIDFREGAVSRCRDRCASRSVIDEGHFADDSPPHEPPQK